VTLGVDDGAGPALPWPVLPWPVLPGDDDPVALALDPSFVLPTRLAWWATRQPDRPFMDEVDGRSATYGEFVDQMLRWCSRLTALGVQRGDRVLSLIPASIDAHALWLAAGCIGALEVPVNPELRGTFLAHALRDPGARWCFVRPEHADVPGSADVAGLDVMVVPRDGSFLAGVEPVALSSWPAPGDTSCVIYTSGTTGAAKGVLITWAQMTATIGRIPRSWFSGGDAVYTAHPVFHVTGRSPLLSMSDVGGRVVVREKLSVAAYWDDVRRYRCTSTTVNAALVLTAPERDDDIDNPLRVAFTAGNRAAAFRFAERFGVHMVEAYGSTEVGFPIMLRAFPTDDSRSCGVLRPGYAARIVDEAGVEVPDGVAGELWLRPPARELITSGYLGRDDLTAAAIVDGWYRTGDRLVRHANGHFEFVDRMNDTIRRLGENISGTALEAVVIEEADVAECAAVGVADPVAGQEVLIAVIARDGCAIDPADLHLRLAARLPRYMVPKFIAVVDELPRTATSKVRKRDLLEALDLAQVWRIQR
jgi:carnitine-CoA ligase